MSISSTDPKGSCIPIRFELDDRSENIAIGPSESGQLTIFNEPDLVLHLNRTSANHYTMRLGDKYISLKLLGKGALVCFGSVNSDTVDNKLASACFNDLNDNPTIQKFARKFHEAMIAHHILTRWSVINFAK